MVETEKRLLEAWNCDVPVKLTHKLPGSMRASKDGYDKSKRALFAEDKKELRALGVKAADATIKDALGHTDEASVPARYMKVMEDGTLAHFVPDRRARLLDALASIASPTTKTSPRACGAMWLSTWTNANRAACAQPSAPPQPSRNSKMPTAPSAWSTTPATA